MPSGIVLPGSPSAWLLGAALIFAPLTSIRVTPLVSVCDVLFLLAVAVGAVEKVLLRESVRIVPIYILAALLFLASYLVNINIRDPKFTQSFYILMINAVLIPSAILFVRVRTQGEMRSLVYLWSLGGFYGAAFAVLYCKGFIPGHTEYYWTKLGRVAGLTPHPNVQAMNSILAVPGLLLLFASTRLWVRAAVLIMLVTIWMAVDYSGSRAAGASLILMIGIFSSLFFLQATTEQRAWMLLGFLALMFLVGAYIIFGSINPRPRSALWRFIYAPYLSSNVERSAVNVWAWRGFLEAPFFGQGYHWTRVAHNIYLQQLHTAGLVGLAGYLISLLTPSVWLYRALSLGGNRVFIIALATMNISLLIAAWYWSSYTDLNITFAFALTLFAGVMICGQAAAQNPHRRPSWVRPAQRVPDSFLSP